MNIFIERDYRLIVKMLIEHKKKSDETATFQNLAEKIRVPKSYVSKVVNGKADFSSDQIFLCAQYFDLNEDQANYLELLVNYERSALKNRKDLINSKIEYLRKKYLKTEDNLNVTPSPEKSIDMARYYSDTLHLLIHQCLTINRYRLSPQLMFQDLNFPSVNIRKAIDNLVDMGVIAREGKPTRS